MLFIDLRQDEILSYLKNSHTESVVTMDGILIDNSSGKVNE